MSSISFKSPIGPLTIHEQCGAITSLCWGQWENRDVSSLLISAKKQVQEYLKGKRKNFELPKNPCGSDFQLSVWREIDRIAFGQTASYGELAFKLSSSPRAVGTACVKNPLPVIIPCHRIIAKSGNLTGYSGGRGVETKRLLLSLETKACLHDKLVLTK